MPDVAGPMNPMMPPATSRADTGATVAAPHSHATPPHPASEASEASRTSAPVPSAAAMQDVALAANLLDLALQPEHRLIATIAGAPEVPGYDVLRWLGAGSSGEVWLADELETGRIVALKILHRHGATGSSAELLQREIQMLAKLIHPNLVLLHRAVATTDGRQGLATEWIDGWPLDEWLRQHPDLTLNQKLELFHGIVRGVAFLHDNGVIHRDLKPANLIVTTEGVPKIVDFGLARLHQEGMATEMDGGSIGAAGTLHFMAPEQAANGDGARAMPVDVYALGLILYRLLTGNWLRSTEGTPAETLAVVLNPPPLTLPRPARSLPRDLQSILRRALAPDPAWRYRHARDLEADLDRFAAKLPVAARPHTVFYLTAMLLRRQARRSIIAACLVLAGLTVVGVIYHRHRQMTLRNEANLRYAYTLTSFTLGRLRDQLRTAAPDEAGAVPASAAGLPTAEAGKTPTLPVNAKGDLDLRYYQALLLDIHSATAEAQEDYRAAFISIQPALDHFSQLAREAPNDPNRLLDAAQARLSFARLLDRTGRTDSAGIEAHKTLRQLDRLAAWVGFDPTPLPPLRCDALRLAAKDAHRVGDSPRAVQLALEFLALAESLPSGLLVRPENESEPRLALAASDLATYAIAAGGDWLPEAQQKIDNATSRCRTAYEQDPDNPAMARGLAQCLHAKARLALHEDPGADLRQLFREAATLWIGESSRGRLFSFVTIRSFCRTATIWVEGTINHPDPEVSKAALGIADKLVSYVRENGGATDEISILRARLFLYQSRFACRVQDRDEAAHTVSRAVRMLRPRQGADPHRLSLALLTAAALHQARALRESPMSDWNEAEDGARLERLLKQLTERSAELTPEQRQDLSLLQQPENNADRIDNPH